MTNWHIHENERLELYSPIGFRLIDEFTGRPPIGSIVIDLDVKEGANWRTTDIKASRSMSGIVIFPRLGRRADPIGVLPETYRVRISAEYYRPFYCLTSDGIEFKVYPYNDTNPPTDYTVNPPVVIKPQVQDEKLIPGVNYPFPTHVRVLRGQVKDAAGQPVIHAEVIRNNAERAVSGEKGAYALPLRWTVNGVPVPIDATNHRTGQTGTINITLPGALGSSQDISIP
jgi:stalled ribosome alternative rescue factor ArfA